MSKEGQSKSVIWTKEEREAVAQTAARIWLAKGGNGLMDMVSLREAQAVALPKDRQRPPLHDRGANKALVSRMNEILKELQKEARRQGKKSTKAAAPKADTTPETETPASDAATLPPAERVEEPVAASVETERVEEPVTASVELAPAAAQEEAAPVAPAPMTVQERMRLVRAAPRSNPTRWTTREQELVASTAAAFILQEEAAGRSVRPMESIRAMQAVALPPDRQRPDGSLKTRAANASLVALVERCVRQGKETAQREAEAAALVARIEAEAAAEAKAKAEAEAAKPAEAAAAPAEPVEAEQAVAPESAADETPAASIAAGLGAMLSFANAPRRQGRDLNGLVHELTRRVAAQVAFALQDEILDVICNLVDSLPPAPAPTISVPDLIEKATDRRPKVLLYGVKGDLYARLKTDFCQQLDLLYLESGKGMSGHLEEMVKHCDAVIGACDFIGHSAEQILKHSKRYVRVNGGLSSMRDELRKVIARTSELHH